MKLYATSIPPALPTWVTIISKKAGLIEVEINDEDPGFHSIIEELSTEIQPVFVGVKVIAHKAVSVDALAQPLVEKRLVVRHRPGKSEPRVRKRRPKIYPLMTSYLPHLFL